MILKILPNKGSIRGMALFPFILVKRNYTHDPTLVNHEKIHLRQQLELLLVFFYLAYVVEWLFKGYEGISFEREAHENEKDLGYLKSRGFWRFLKYI